MLAEKASRKRHLASDQARTERTDLRGAGCSSLKHLYQPADSGPFCDAGSASVEANK
jgi:hypothetical protein